MNKKHLKAIKTVYRCLIKRENNRELYYLYVKRNITDPKKSSAPKNLTMTLERKQWREITY